MTAAQRIKILPSPTAHRGVRRAARRAASCSARGGFSLFELLIAMSVIAIIAAVAVPRYASSVGRYRAESAARRVAADLTLAQAKARAAKARAAAEALTAENQKLQHDLLGGEKQ